MPQDTTPETTSTTPPPPSTSDPQGSGASTEGTQSATGTTGTTTGDLVDPKINSGVREATVNVGPKNSSGTRGA